MSVQQVVGFFSTWFLQEAVVQLDNVRILVTYANLTVLVVLIQASCTLSTNLIIGTVGLTTTAYTSTTTSHYLNEVVGRLLAGGNGLEGHYSVPVRRGGDMNYVHIGVMDKVAPVPVDGRIHVETLLRGLVGRTEMIRIGVAERYKTATVIAEKMVRGTADSAYAYHAMGNLVARCDV